MPHGKALSSPDSTTALLATGELPDELRLVRPRLDSEAVLAIPGTDRTRATPSNILAQTSRKVEHGAKKRPNPIGLAGGRCSVHNYEKQVTFMSYYSHPQNSTCWVYSALSVSHAVPTELQPSRGSEDGQHSFLNWSIDCLLLLLHIGPGSLHILHATNSHLFFLPLRFLEVVTELTWRNLSKKACFP